MIKGIGHDIVKIERIKKMYDEFGEKMLARFYHCEEAEKFNQIKIYDKKIAYLAKRFAAKEALAKAMGTGISGAVKFQNMAILNDDRGKPFFKLEPEFLHFFKLKFKDAAILLSLSDEKNLASAFVVIGESDAC